MRHHCHHLLVVLAEPVYSVSQEAPELVRAENSGRPKCWRSFLRTQPVHEGEELGREGALLGPLRTEGSTWRRKGLFDKAME